MPKLILDEEALKLAASKLQGQPIYSSSDGKLIAPGIIDIIDYGDAREKWQPANEPSRHLVLAGEACRDLSFQARSFKEKAYRYRIIKSMTVPLCSLMDQVDRLVSLLNDERSRKFREEWPAKV